VKRSLILTAALVLAVSAPSRAQDDNPLLKQIGAKVGGDDKPFTLMVHLKIKEGSEKKFEELAAKAAKGSRAEKGNLAYEFHRDAEKPTEYVLFERWKNLPALREHFGKDYVKEFLAAMPELADGAPQIRVLTPVGGSE
jgi:quinol monooxygenase YgiN